MTDLTLKINGDSSGAQAAFSEAGGAAGQLGEDVGKSAAKWQLLANAAETAARVVVKFGVDSLKAYADSERIQRQLVRVSGDYAGALDEQAKALSKLYAVDDDVIKQSQILMTQWGGVGAATNDVETAALNLAAAMGGDLNNATTDLIRNVESGGTGLAKLGVHFKATGDKGKDLESAVAAINKKFGGAAGADAESLIGRTHAAQIAIDDLQKSIGGMLTTMLDKSGALGFITERIREMTKGGEVLFAVLSKLPGMAGGVLRGNIDPSLAVDELKNTAFDAFMGGSPASGGPRDMAAEFRNFRALNGRTNKGIKEDAAASASASGKSKTQEELNDASLEAAKKYYAGLDQLEEHAAEQDEKAAKLAEKSSDARTARMEKHEDEFLKALDEQDKALAKADEEANKTLAKSAEEALQRTKKAEEKAKAAGDAIGAAMVNALADQLSKLAEGGEFDAALFIGDIMAAAVGVAGGIIGTALGAPAVGAAVGNLAAMGIRAGASAISKGNHAARQTKQYHSGGWVDVGDIDIPRHHSGAWIAPDEQLAILQSKERVLSRKEVQNMGGPAGVDRAARGGPAVSVTIHAIDSKSAADSFASDLGRGMRQAVRSGRGDLPSLLGVGVR